MTIKIFFSFRNQKQLRKSRQLRNLLLRKKQRKRKPRFQVMKMNLLLPRKPRNQVTQQPKRKNHSVMMMMMILKILLMRKINPKSLRKQIESSGNERAKRNIDSTNQMMTTKMIMMIMMTRQSTLMMMMMTVIFHSKILILNLNNFRFIVNKNILILSCFYSSNPQCPGKTIKYCWSNILNFPYNKCLTVWPRPKHCLTSKSNKNCCVMFLKKFENIFARRKQKVLDEQCFWMWNGQTFVVKKV